MGIFNRKNKLLQSDTALLLLYKQSHDLVYVGDLFERYSTFVYGVCLKYLKDREEAKDAVMQVFEKLIVELKTREINNFKSWLHVVVKNHCLMAIRQNKIKIKEIGFDDYLESEMAVEPEYLNFF